MESFPVSHQEWDHGELGIAAGIELMNYFSEVFHLGNLGMILEQELPWEQLW